MTNTEPYLYGNALFGDDFNESQIAEWFVDVKEGFADIYASEEVTYIEGHYALNRFHSFKYLLKKSFKKKIWFASAFSAQLLPTKNQIESAWFIETIDIFVRDSIYGIPLNYVGLAFSFKINHQ